jgi:predicted metal-dependent hydrolase
MPSESSSTESKFDPRYVDFFRRFNEQQYFEAHEVLEELWQEIDGAPRDFYKGLIQTAAAFLKLQQDKPQPAARLAERAGSHLEKYRPACEDLDVDFVLDLLQDVRQGRNLLAEGQPPQLELGPA